MNMHKKLDMIEEKYGFLGLVIAVMSFLFTAVMVCMILMVAMVEWVWPVIIPPVIVAYFAYKTREKKE